MRKRTEHAEEHAAFDAAGRFLGRLSIPLSFAILLLSACPIAADVARARGYLDMAVAIEAAYSVDVALAQTPLSLGPADELPEYAGFDEDADDAEERAARAVLKLVPSPVLADFAEQGWTLRYTAQKDLSAYMPGDSTGHVTGVTLFAEKTVYVLASSREIVEATGHEFGHYVDWRLGWPSQEEGFARAWEAEREAYADVAGEYQAKDQKEFFASVYNDILLKRDARRACAPQAFALVEKTMGRWGEEAAAGA